MTILELQQKVDHWIREHGVQYFSELTNVAILMEEVGEFAHHMARQYGEQSYRTGTRPDAPKKALADEMADIFFVLTCLANQTGIDIETAMLDNLDKKTRRDRDRHRNNPKLSGNPGDPS